MYLHQLHRQVAAEEDLNTNRLTQAVQVEEVVIEAVKVQEVQVYNLVNQVLQEVQQGLEIQEVMEHQDGLAAEAGVQAEVVNPVQMVTKAEKIQMCLEKICQRLDSMNSAKLV